jgi:hypothetical protein
LSKGGVILIDDCSDEVNQRWRARQGFKQFCDEVGLVAQTRYGFGIIEK